METYFEGVKLNGIRRLTAHQTLQVPLKEWLSGMTGCIRTERIQIIETCRATMKEHIEMMRNGAWRGDVFRVNVSPFPEIFDVLYYRLSFLGHLNSKEDTISQGAQVVPHY
jgi:hypothetical protein